MHEQGPDSALWRFTGPEGPEEIRLEPSFRANNAAIVRRAALDGHGIAMVPEAMVLDDVRSARLYRVLPNYRFEREPAFVLYPSRRHLAARTRVVIDFLVERLNETAARLAENEVWGGSDTAWLV